MTIPMSGADIGEDEVDAVVSVLRSGSLSIGPVVTEFERLAAETSGARHAVAVSSGTAGLHLCLIAAGVADNDLVITTPFSFVASANVMLYERAIPVFVDVEERTGTIDPVKVAEAVTAIRNGDAGPLPRSHKRSAEEKIKAILPVHVFGEPADMDALNDIARAHNLTVIEDACEAIGARYNDRPAGTLGDAAVFAFYPNKQMTTGEGGVIVTDDAAWDALFRSLRNQGRDVHDAWLRHSRLGYNYRLDEMSAAVGVVQIARIDALLSARARVAAWYSERLKTFDGIELPEQAPTTTRASWFVYVVRLARGIDRAALMRALDARGVPSRPYFDPIHLQPFYVTRFGYRVGDFPVAEDLGARSLALPFSGVMTESQVDHVCDALRACLPEMGGTTR